MDAGERTFAAEMVTKITGRLPVLLLRDRIRACKGEPGSHTLEPNEGDSRGRKKRVKTEGYACPNPGCMYHGITDENIHALAGCGKVDEAKLIPRLRCQSCKTTFSSGWGTPLYYLKGATQQVEMVLWFLVEGVDESVLVHYTGHSDATIARWLWLAIDPVSKVIPSLHLGGRTSGDAYALVHDLEERLEDGCVPAFTTDGLRSYF
jgi:hypothetical protein